MEALISREDSENRITIGGKRKSSSRRSSILKATKSPLKAGVLEDLDQNSLDDNERSTSKKSRRSSGRRVSFAEKNDIKEFFIEDWKNSWPKDQENSNPLELRSTSQGEYREPANSIEGLESLLKGNIQAPDDITVCQVDTEEMPEMSILKPSEQADEMEYTICHSSVLQNNATNMENTKIFGHDTVVDLDITCSQKEIFCQDSLKNQLTSPAGFQENEKMDSTSFLLSLGSKQAPTQGVEVMHDIAISATRSSDNTSSRRQPLDEIKYEQGGCDSQRGSQQSSNANVELTTCHSFTVLESNAQRATQGSVYEPTELDFTLCYGQELTKSLDNHEVGVQKGQGLEVPTDVNACRNSFETNLPDQALHVSETQLNRTNCSRNGVSSADDQTNVQEVQEDSRSDSSFDSTVFLRSLGVMKPPLASIDVDRTNAEINQDESEVPGSTGHLNMTHCHGTGILPNTRLPVLISGTNQTMIFNSDTNSTDSIDLTVCQTQKQQAAPAPFLTQSSPISQNEPNSLNTSSSKMNSSVFLRSLSVVMPSADTDEEECDLELTSCHSQPVLENMAQNSSQNSATELADLDVTSCHGPGLLQSEDNCDRSNVNIGIANKFYESADVDVTVCNGSGLKSSGENVDEEGHCQAVVDSNSQKTKMRSPFKGANYATSCNSPLPLKSSGKHSDEFLGYDQSFAGSSYQKSKRRSLYEAADIDVTSCFGAGLLKTTGGELDAKALSNQAVLDNGLHKNTRRSIYEAADIDVTSCFGAGLLKTTGGKLDTMAPCDQPVVDNSLRKNIQKSPDEPVDIDVTSCNGAGLLRAIDEKLDAMAPCVQGVEDSSLRKRSRRSVYEPVDVDVTSCFGAGLLKTTGKNLNSLAPNDQPVVDKSCLKTNRRSVYESEDIDLTSCYEVGRLRSDGEKLDADTSENQHVVDNSSKKNERKSIYDSDDVDVTSCFGQGMVQVSSSTVTPDQLLVNSSLHRIKRRSHYEPADVDMTSCHGSGMVCESQPAEDISTRQEKGRSLYEPTGVDITSCHGSGMVTKCKETVEETELQHQSAPHMDGPKYNRRSLHEPIDIDVTSCYGQGTALATEEDLEFSFFHQQLLPNSTLQKSDERSVYQSKDMDVISCYDSGMARSSKENVGKTVYQSVADESKQITNQQNLYKPQDSDMIRCQGAEPVSTPRDRSLQRSVIETQLNLVKGPLKTFSGAEDVALVEKGRDLNTREKETPHSSRVLFSSKACLETDANDSLEKDEKSSFSSQQRTLKADCGVRDSSPDRQLSVICEESLSELRTKQMIEEEVDDIIGEETMKDSTRNAITLKEFLDIIEIAFITEVNMRRSVVPSAVGEAPQTPKDRMISTLVSKPKAICYEEAIPTVESGITAMKERVEQQEMELNVSNPRIFMEVQTASKEELLVLQSKVRRLRSVCEKTSKREWKEGKGQLNKKVLSKLTENHAALAKDVLIVEESVEMVDDCLNILDTINKDFDEKMRNIHSSLTENEKKIQEQSNMVEELATMSERVRTSEQALADLESTRSRLQSERHELAKNKERLDGKILETEETIRLVKRKDPRRNKSTRDMSQKLDILESLQDWSLEEWNEERAKFAFLKNTLEIVVVFVSETTGGVNPNQNIGSIQLNFTTTDTFTGRMGKVQTLVKQLVNEDILNQMCSSKKDLAKVLEHMSGIIHKSKEMGDELFRIGLSHLMSFEEERLVVEFSSLKAFVKFVLHIQVGFSSYPNSVSFSALPKIGHLSQTEIEATLNAVSAGKRYLSRLVEAADQLLSTIKPVA